MRPCTFCALLSCGNALATLNVTSEETLDVLTRLGSGSLPTIQAEMRRLTQEYFGLNEAQAEAAVRLRGQGASYEEIASSIGSTVEVVEAWDNAMRTTTTFADQNKAEINALALEYLNLQARIPGAASDTLLAAEAIAGNRNEAGNAIPVFQEYLKQILLLTPAEQAAIVTTDGFAATIEELIPGLTGATGGTEGLTGATGELETVSASTIDTMSTLQEVYANIDKRVGIYSDALDRALGNSREWMRVHFDFAGALADFGDEIEDASAGVDYNTEAGRANAEAGFDMADGVLALTQANIDSNRPLEETRAEYEAGREALLDAAEAAGLNRDEVNNLISEYGLVPELVTTTLEIAGQALSQWAIQRQIDKLNEIDPVVATEIETLINAGMWDAAMAMLNSIPDPVVDLQVRVKSIRVVDLGSGQVGYDTGGAWIATARGGFFDEPSRRLVGEAGPEVVLPLSNLGRMSALLSMPQVGPAVAAAMPTSGGGGDTYYDVKVFNNGRDITPNDIARAIRMARVSA